MENIHNEADIAGWLQLCDIKIKGKEKQLAQNRVSGMVMWIFLAIGIAGCVMPLFIENDVAKTITAIISASLSLISGMQKLKSDYAEGPKLKTDLEVLKWAGTPPPSDLKFQRIDAIN